MLPWLHSTVYNLKYFDHSVTCDGLDCVQPMYMLSESGGFLGFLPTGVAVAIAAVLGYNLIRQASYKHGPILRCLCLHA